MALLISKALHKHWLILWCCSWLATSVFPGENNRLQDHEKLRHEAAIQLEFQFGLLKHNSSDSIRSFSNLRHVKCVHCTCTCRGGSLLSLTGHWTELHSSS